MPAKPDPDAVVIHVVRHGQVENPQAILYGRLPGFVLTPLGVQMAGQVAQWSQQRPIVAVVSSPLERAQQTAAPIAAAHGLAVSLDERLIEAANAYQGQPVGSAKAVLSRQHWVKLTNPFKPSWGEPYAEQAQRMLAAVRAVHDQVAAAGGGDAVCVSHQLPIWVLRRHLEGRKLWHDPRRRQCTLASVTSLSFRDGQFAGLTYSEPAAELLPVSARRCVDVGADISSAKDEGTRP